MFPLRINRLRSGFSLVELLTVLAIILLLAVASIAGYAGIARGAKLKSAANMITSQLLLAKQEAITKNEQVTVRFYELPDPNLGPGSAPTQFRALQLFVTTYTDVTNANVRDIPFGKIIYLPTPIIILPGITTTASTFLVPTLSPALIKETDQLDANLALLATPPPIPIYGSNYHSVEFSFLPGGITNLPLQYTPATYNSTSLGNSWYLTLGSAYGLPANGVSKNFITIQIDPMTGSYQLYRP